MPGASNTTSQTLKFPIGHDFRQAITGYVAGKHRRYRSAKGWGWKAKVSLDEMALD
ncbi:MAG: hypothetical protein R2773_04095 [Flavobacteriaceae bacterium]